MSAGVVVVVTVFFCPTSCAESINLCYCFVCVTGITMRASRGTENTKKNESVKEPGSAFWLNNNNNNEKRVKNQLDTGKKVLYLQFSIV